MKGLEKKFLTAVVVAILLWVAYFGLFVFKGAGPDGDYGFLYDGVFFTLMTLFLYWQYDRLNLDLLTYSLLLGLILFHIAGAFWWYGTMWGPFEFDMVIHFTGGVVLSFLFYRFVTLDTSFYDKTWASLLLIIMLCVLGLSSIHELMEFFGYAYLGEGSGIFMYGKGDFGEYHDISWDLLMNAFGAVFGTLTAYKVYEMPG